MDLQVFLELRYEDIKYKQLPEQWEQWDFVFYGFVQIWNFHILHSSDCIPSFLFCYLLPQKLYELCVFEFLPLFEIWLKFANEIWSCKEEEKSVGDTYSIIEKLCSMLTLFFMVTLCNFVVHACFFHASGLRNSSDAKSAKFYLWTYNILLE